MDILTLYVLLLFDFITFYAVIIFCAVRYVLYSYVFILYFEYDFHTK